MDRVELPTATGLTTIRVKKLSGTKALLTDLAKKIDFELPAALLPEDAREGEDIALQIQPVASAEANHNHFAARLLEEIMN